MEWTIVKIRQKLGDKLIGNKYMRGQVCKALLFLPGNIIDRVCKTVWFVSSPEDSWAFTFRGSDINNRHLIFISDELLRQSAKQIQYTILHEVGHVILNHRNSIGYSQSQTEIDNQEHEANSFVRKYFPNT